MNFDVIHEANLLLTHLYIWAISISMFLIATGALIPPSNTLIEVTMPINYFPEDIAEERVDIPVEEEQSPIISNFTIRELKSMARGHVRNYGNMTKAELLEELTALNII